MIADSTYGIYNMPTKRSVVHTLLQCSPGQLPRWLVSKDLCMPFDVCGGLMIVASILLIFISGNSPINWSIVAIAIGLCEYFVLEPARKCERIARADEWRAKRDEAK